MPSSTIPTATASPSVAVLTPLLHLLRGQLLQLLSSDPYRLARLNRIADQLTYVVLVWPPAQWPVRSSQEHIVPPAAVLLTQLSKLPTEAGARQQELRRLLVLLL